MILLSLSPGHHSSDFAKICCSINLGILIIGKFSLGQRRILHKLVYMTVVIYKYKNLQDWLLGCVGGFGNGRFEDKIF